MDYPELVEQIAPSMYRLAFSYTKRHCDAEDIVQEALLRWLRHARRFQSSEDSKRWLLTVTANLCKDLVKSARWRREVAIECAEAEASALQDQEQRMDVEAALFSLPEKYRAVIFLHYYEGYPTKEIAAILHLTQSAVLSRLERARNRLKLKLGGDRLEE